MRYLYYEISHLFSFIFMRYWFIAALLVMTIIGLSQRNQSTAQYAQLAHSIRHPFDARVHYRIGHIDAQFGISEAEVIQLAAEAAQIWQQGTGKVLFVYDPNALLSINLHFDDRQDNANHRRIEQQKLQQQLSQQKDNSNDYDQRKLQLAQQRQQLNAQEAEFEQQLNQYNRSVASWNTLGSLDDFNREQLRQKRQQLDFMRQQIHQATDDYNQQVNTLNQVASSINHMADHYNQAVNTYQTQFTAREFEKGRFDGQQITIYEFERSADLRLAIAHELGHALGLDHNNDPYALMYPILKQQNMDNFYLRPADLALLSQR